VVNAKDLLDQLLRNQALELRPLLINPLFVPESSFVSRLLELFKSTGTHFAVVISEHGGVEGIVTLNDVLEEIVGDIDAEEPEAIRREDNSWLLDGTISIRKMEHLFPGFLPPEDETHEYSTLAGFIMARLDRIPIITDKVMWKSFQFEIMDMDGNRIDKVLLTLHNSPPPEDNLPI
jgi:putative hemolysin